MRANNSNSTGNQSPILQNAISSLRMGVEDYKNSRNDPDRRISAIRNIFASLLLFLKEGLCRFSPSHDPELLIKSKIMPVKLPNGSVQLIGKGKNTIDVRGIRERYESLGFNIEWKPLEKIQDERNNVEHYYSTTSIETVQSVIRDASVFIIDVLVNILKIDPHSTLGQLWTDVVEIQVYYDKIKEFCNETLKILVKQNILTEDQISLIERFTCHHCHSQQYYFKTGNNSSVIDENIDIDTIDECLLVCKSCHEEIPIVEAFEAYAFENFEPSFRELKHGEPSIVKECPECHHYTYIDDGYIGSCLLCEFEIGDQRCIKCGSLLTIDELDSDGFCADCYWDYLKAIEDD